MLYHLFDYLAANYDFQGENLYRFISFRAGSAVIVSLIISMTFGKKIIEAIKNFQVIEKQRSLGLPGEALKAKTPTMGGILIIMAILIPTLLFADLTNIYIQLMILSTVWMGIIGFIDDYLKLKRGKEGLAGKWKVLGQVGLGLIVAATMLWHNDITVRMTDADKIKAKGYEIVETIPQINKETGVATDTAYYVKTTMTNIPFFSGHQLDYAEIMGVFGKNAKKYVWILFIPLVIFIVTAVSNAANLTDGVDGLATGVSAIIGATLGIIAYLSGNIITAEYLNIFYIPYSAELTIFTASFLGATIGFLWYNAHPAQVFMGDVGSLTLGGIIAALAIVTRKEWLIPILCGIFVVENLSVLLQVGYFKYTKKRYGEGRRIFKMSPLHHHYQKLGMHEAKLVTRFWIVGIILAVFTLIILKIR